MLQGKRCWTCSFQEETNMIHLVVFLERVPHQNWGTNIARKTAPYIRALRPTPNVKLSLEEPNLVS